jgi:hypothetical protein
MATTTLTADGDGTTTGWTRSPASGTFASKCEVIGSTDDDTTYILSPNVADGTIWLTLSNVPADFDPAAVSAISIRVRHRRLNTPQMAVDDGTVNARLVRADETTAISTTPTAVASAISASYTTTTFTPSPTGTHTVTDWNGCRLELTFDHTQQQTADTVNQIRITSVDATITYTPLAHSASGALAMGPAVLTASAVKVHMVSGALGLGPATLAAAAAIVRSASGALTVPASILAAETVAGAAEASGALTLAPAVLAAQADVERTASGDLDLPPASLAAVLDLEQVVSAELGLSALGLVAALATRRPRAGRGDHQQQDFQRLRSRRRRNIRENLRGDGSTPRFRDHERAAEFDRNHRMDAPHRGNDRSYSAGGLGTRK